MTVVQSHLREFCIFFKSQNPRNADDSILSKLCSKATSTAWFGPKFSRKQADGRYKYHLSSLINEMWLHKKFDPIMGSLPSLSLLLDSEKYDPGHWIANHELLAVIAYDARWKIFSKEYLDRPRELILKQTQSLGRGIWYKNKTPRYVLLQLP